MTTDPVELLERAIGYTRGVLVLVTPEDLSRGTPCAAWDLAALLDHMTDSLDALTEASRGFVSVAPPQVPRGAGVPSLCDRAGLLLGAWTGPAARDVRLVQGHGEPPGEPAERRLESTRLLRAGAIEIAVHGWDVHRSIGRGTDFPEALACDLLPAAYALVDARDRGVRFSRAIPPEPGDCHASQLLGHLGRRTGVRHSPL